jgi:endonuclease/exonuclease/phosphatase family metal-dependent hydrolase/3',5'-cyclic AMP phosphodiesterase CpdA
MKRLAQRVGSREWQATCSSTLARATLRAAGLLVWAGCHAAPSPGDAAPLDGGSEPVRVVVLSDLNSSYGSTEYEPEVAAAVARAVEEWRPDLVLIAGDMVAGQRPALEDAQVRAMWAAFDSVVAAPLRSAGIPLAVTVGNHDASGHPGHERDRSLAFEYWRSHGPTVRVLEGGTFPFRYAFTVGDVFFLVLDASTGGVVADTAQMAWVGRALATPEARSARLRFSLGHVPLYAVAEGRDRPGEVQGSADSLRTVLETGGVRLHVSGHHHAYYPGRRGSLELLHTGALGQSPRPLLGSDAPPMKTVTVLDLFPAGDSLVEHTYRVEGDRFEPLDPGSLPHRIEGHTGSVFRSDRRRAADRTGGPGTTHTIVSFNIRAGTDLERQPSLDRVAAFLDSLDADVVLLQEVDRGTSRSGGVDQLAELRRMTGMDGVFGRAIEFDGGEYGIALLSRWPVLESHVVPLPAELPVDLVDAGYEPRVTLVALLDSPWGPLPVLNTHLSHQAWGTYRRQELVGLMGELGRRWSAAGTVIVGGDFNATPDSPEVAAITLALRDAWEICGTGDGGTYPSGDPVRRIDYLFLRGAGCAVAEVPVTTISDHRPLVVEVYAAPEAGPAGMR